MLPSCSEFNSYLFFVGINSDKCPCALINGWELFSTLKRNRQIGVYKNNSEGATKTHLLSLKHTILELLLFITHTTTHTTHNLLLLIVLGKDSSGITSSILWLTLLVRAIYLHEIILYFLLKQVNCSQNVTYLNIKFKLLETWKT